MAPRTSIPAGRISAEPKTIALFAVTHKPAARAAARSPRGLSIIRHHSADPRLDRFLPQRRLRPLPDRRRHARGRRRDRAAGSTPACRWSARFALHHLLAAASACAPPCCCWSAARWLPGRAALQPGRGGGVHPHGHPAARRRGGRVRPCAAAGATANAEFGNPASVLVGDFLYSRAFQMMLDAHDMRVMEILADATNVIAEGEVHAADEHARPRAGRGRPTCR